MTAEIVQLKTPDTVAEPEPRIWTCGSCGCQTFMLYEDGSTKCALCRAHDPDQHGGWAADKVEDENFDPDMTKQFVMHADDDNSVNLQKEQILRAIRNGRNRHGAETSLIFIGYANGGIDTISRYVDIEKPGVRDWVLAMMADGANTLLGLGHNDPGPKPE